MILTAAFADDTVTGLDGYSRLISRTSGQRVRNQLLDVSAGFFYSFFATFILLLFSKLVLKLLRPIVKYFKIAYHERSIRYNEDYRKRVGDYDPGAEDDHKLQGAKVIKDKLVALGQHSSLQPQEVV